MSQPPAPLTYDTYRGRPYFPALDGARALCLLLVVSVHLYDAGARWAWLAGARGVTVFFVLSGYLITALALREEDRRGSVSLAAFYVRRCCRLLPLYYLTLAAYAACVFALGMGGPGLRDAFALALPYYLGYVQEVPFYTLLVGAGRDLPFFHSWSLGVEEKFYLLWPLLAFVLWRGSRRRRLRRTLLLAGCLAAAAFLPAPWGRYLVCYFHLLLGCAAAILLHDRQWFERLARLGRAAPQAAAAATLAGLHFLTPHVAEPSAAGTLLHAAYGVAAAAVLTSLVTNDGWLSRALAWGPLAFVGRLSYGAYLIHVFAVVAAYRVVPLAGPASSAAAYALACALSVAGAWLLAVTVERRGIDAGRRWSRLILERPRPAVDLPSRPHLAQ